MTDLVVIGGASLDLLHLAGRTERSAGGAGLYTALAAHRAGARVTMIGPRPEPVPPQLAAAAERLDWRGPAVPPERLPSFEIAHLGGRTEMREHRSRAEADLAVADLPSDLRPGLVYCIALVDSGRQLEFMEHFKSEGRRLGAGAYAAACREAPETVRRIVALADVFFCNELEATELFGGLERAVTTPGKLLFVTRGSNGVRVVQGDHATEVAAIEVEELDPTGAGDTFCGATLTWLERGLHPVLAAERGVAAAAEVVTGIGPEKLLLPPAKPPPGRPPRTAIDGRRVAAVAKILAELPEAEPFSFTGPLYPAAGHPRALELFCASTLQQFGFWTDAGGRYRRPIVAEVDGAPLKGSDFLAACYRRWLERAPAGLTPTAQAALTGAELRARLSDDDGACPLPDLGERLRLARRYGGDLLALGLDPGDLVRRANAAERPLEALLRLLDRVGGYKEDPLRKKSALLGLILRQRPEAFLRAADDDDAPPIVDYHVQRSCLRMGLVRILDPGLARRLAGRELIEPPDESEIRRACARAVDELRRSSGRPMGAVDWFLFQNRTRCPEMADPDCARCPVDPACAHARELFQPVLRTTFY